MGYMRCVVLWRIVTLAAMLALSSEAVTNIPVAISETIMWGPGLNANFQMPTRYIYLQMVDKGGDNMTESVGDVMVSVSDEETSRRAHAAVKVFDRKDGSYVVAFRPLSPAKDLLLTITIGEHGQLGPIPISGYIYQEGCNCPMPASDWLNALQCPESFSQLDEDLDPFLERSIDMRAVEKVVHEKFPKRPGNGALMHYVIKNNRVYRKDVGTITGFKIFSDSIFLSLARKTKLPDVEFFINLGDWPLVKKSGELFPIISWCGSDDTRDIILPTYDITEATMKSLYGVTLDLLSIQGHDAPAWREKIPKALFRGRDSRRERLDLVALSREGDNSELIDAGITAFFFFPKNESLSSERVSFFDYFKYKYQINIDGTVAAYRMPYLMAGGSLILKQDSKYYEHFYNDLEPWKHYIPLKSDLSDVLETIQWAKDHDREARQIAKNAGDYARDNLTPSNIFCYYYTWLKKYSEKLKSSVDVLDEMEEAPQPTYMANCDCHRDHVKDEL